ASPCAPHRTAAQPPTLRSFQSGTMQAQLFHPCPGLALAGHIAALGARSGDQRPVVCLNEGVICRQTVGLGRQRLDLTVLLLGQTHSGQSLVYEGVARLYAERTL